MKRTGRCPKCTSDRVGHLSRLPDTRGSETDVSWRYLGLAREVDGKLHPVGQLEAYICTDCGYLEHHVREPAKVPFDKLEGWTPPGETTAGPYR